MANEDLQAQLRLKDGQISKLEAEIEALQKQLEGTEDLKIKAEQLRVEAEFLKKEAKLMYQLGKRNGQIRALREQLGLPPRRYKRLNHLRVSGKRSD